MREQMRAKHAAATLCILVGLFCTETLAEEATGKLVWIDKKNSILLIECTETGCSKIPSAKAGETYSFAIPAKLAGAAATLKEGQQITVRYEETKEGSYALQEVKQ